MCEVDLVLAQKPESADCERDCLELRGSAFTL